MGVKLIMGKGKGEFPLGDWNNGLCGCFNNLGNCCCGCWCGPCQMGQNGERLDEGYWLCCLATWIVPCIPIFMLRQKIRERYGIEGSDLGDVAVSVCCGCCASVQIANELDDNEAHRYQLRE